MIENFDTLISEAKEIAISGHIRPDGDCVGSCLALYNYIVDNFPEVSVRIFLDKIPDKFLFLRNSSKIESIHNMDTSHVFDLYIALDCSEGSRLGEAYECFSNAKSRACIDHHFSNSGSFADYNYIIPDYSSTCELVYNQLKKELITKEIAECLYVGVIHDTGVFQYSCTTKDTMNCAGFLMDKGIDYSRICDETYYSSTLVQNRMLGKALLEAKVFENGKIIAAVITASDRAEFGAVQADLDGIVQTLRDTAGVEVAIFLYELDDGTYKGSTRATGEVDLTVVTGFFGGGGHKKAAGFSVETDNPWSVVDKVIDLVNEQF